MNGLCEKCNKFGLENRLTGELIVKNGHLECLRYALENGCELDRMAPIYAMENNHIECYNYCLEYFQNSNKDVWKEIYEMTHLFCQMGNGKIENNSLKKYLNIDPSKIVELQEQFKKCKQYCETQEQTG